MRAFSQVLRNTGIMRWDPDADFGLVRPNPWAPEAQAAFMAKLRAHHKSEARDLPLITINVINDTTPPAGRSKS